MAYPLMPMPKSRFSCKSLDVELSIMWEELQVLFLQLIDLMVLILLRYYDYKRTAEKKEQKTIEAADKVRKCVLF